MNKTKKMYINGLTKKKNKLKQLTNIETYHSFNFPLSPIKTDLKNLKKKYVRFSQLPKTLSNKLSTKIIKESLILALREEFQYNEKIKETFENYLNEVTLLKSQVKKNKEEVEFNCEKLKAEFQEKFVVVDNYEKRIELLNEEKKEIIRTNEEIIKLKNEQRNLLQKQFDKVQEDSNKQMDEITQLKIKINELTDINLNLNSELEKEQEIQEQKYQELIKQYLELSKKCEYYQIEYDKFDMLPHELIKKNINLFDDTLSKEILVEENLKIKLFEQKYIQDELITNKKNLKDKLTVLEETQNELKRREEKYGKNMFNEKSNIKSRQAKQNFFKTKFDNTKTKLTFNRTYLSKNDKRMKTVENERNIVF